jgi:ATP-dependent Clp protease ATP-binding subunit ClpX
VTRPVVDPRAPLTAGGINAVRAYTSDDDTRRMNPAVVVGASRGGLCPTCSSAVQPMWPKALLPNEVGVHGADNGPTYWCASCKDVCKDPIRRGGAHGSNDDGVTGVVDTNGGISGALHYPAMSPTARAPQSSSLGFTSHGMLPTAVPGGIRRRGGELAGHGDARRTGGAVRGAHHRRRRRRRIGALI